MTRRLKVSWFVLAACLLSSLAVAAFWGTANVGAQTAEAASAQAKKKELLVYDWNKPITQAQSGFAMDKPPRANGNWINPVNYAGGTLYFRAHIKSIPQNQPGMKLGWCFWQQQREQCKGNRVAGVPGTIVTWSVPVNNMWKKNGVSINWAQPRTKNGFVVRNSKNDPVSDKANFNWSGENPAHWYPMNIRFTVVVVAKGATFSGWNNYIK